MTVALNTTKRKFAKLLDNLTGVAPSPAASTSSSAAIPNVAPVTSTNSVPAAEPFKKRARLSDVANENMSRPETPDTSVRKSFHAGRPSTDSPRAQSVRLVKKASVELSSSPRKTPNYAPWSQELFLDRLKTFADVKLWTTKPDELGEVEWAKRGWTLEGWNKVACKGGCEKRVVVRLSPKRKDKEGREIERSEDTSTEIDEELVTRYVSMITSGHGENCLWRKGGSKNDIYHIPLARRDRCERDLVRRYQSLLPISDSLPPVESITLPATYPEDIPKFVTKSLFEPAPESNVDAAQHTQIQTIALTLAVFGWTGTIQEGVRLLLCEHCFQRIGLWMYTSQRITEMSEKLGVEADHLRLNVLATHREHCPWKNSESQHNPSDGLLAGLTAWETLVNTLKRTKKDSVVSSTSRPTTSSGGHDTLSQAPVTPARNTSTAGDNVFTDDDELAGRPSMAYTELSASELEKRDKERTTKWAKLKARMSFRRPKSRGSIITIANTSPESRGKGRSVTPAGSSRPATPPASTT